MFAADHSAMFTADKTAHEINTLTATIGAEFWVASSSDALRRFTVAGGVKSRLHRVTQVYTPGLPASQGCYISVVVTEPSWACGLPLSSVQDNR
jgi:hypothetical protein